ncbi:DUF192 domain-containing protein [Natrinema pallidum]|uniref:DUF192 domain-containing protein n=1 Tax=Natrinema pallidum DSM 3751 TaxID=1227495 RepID=L9YGG0_9EURY|nr:DUF192 domain-containing protein [Natrinema pallidum]ELY72632.1 hypothetical protein C487_18251 [Natrinema pallidum DSM 3751]
MAVEYVLRGLLVIAGLSLVGLLLVQVGLVSAPWAPDSGEVRVFDGGGDGKTTADGGGNRIPKAVVDVAVADSGVERYTGLSDHDSLEPGNGMLFVHDEEREQTYVMRGMDFDIDIVFIDADREITTIHHARAPGPDEDGEELRYTGRGKWVLEVPRGYANETGIEVGDEVDIDLENRGGIIGSGSETLTQAVTRAEHEPIVPVAVAAEHGSVRR